MSNNNLEGVKKLKKLKVCKHQQTLLVNNNRVQVIHLLQELKLITTNDCHLIIKLKAPDKENSPKAI